MDTELHTDAEMDKDIHTYTEMDKEDIHSNTFDNQFIDAASSKVKVIT